MILRFRSDYLNRMIELNSFIVNTKSANLKCNVMIKDTLCCLLKKYEDKTKFDLLCKNGCPNFEKKWSCPPFAPLYSNFTSKYKKILLIVITTELNQFSYIKNDYLKIKAANTIMKSRIDRYLRNHISDDTYYISTGSCRMCKPCKCKLYQPCAHPKTKTFSFEALGIDVSQMINDVFGFELQWYKKGFLPQFTSVVAGYLYNGNIDLSCFLNDFVNG